MKILGDSIERRVYVNGRCLDPRRSQRVWNHSPDGFSWGYGGSGPAQLALALLLHAGLQPRHAIALHQRFKWQYIAPLPFGRDFELDVDVRAWSDAQRSQT